MAERKERITKLTQKQNGDKLALQQIREKQQQVTWGIGDDADADDDFSQAGVIEGFQAKENAFYRKDPRKSLLHWFDHRGLDEPAFEFEIERTGRFT